MAKEINHKETLVRVNTQNELVEPNIGYDKSTYETGEYGTPGSEFDEIQLIDGERLVSLEELMLVNTDSYVTALRNIVAQTI